MHPSKVGDVHDIAKPNILNWLAPGKKWLIHPMYFPPTRETRDEDFPCRYADNLQVRLVGGDITQRQHLVKAVAHDPGYLFLDPDTGLRLDKTRSPQHVTLCELIKIANSDVSTRNLVLVYDHTIDRNFKRKYPDGERKGLPGEQVGKKLRTLHKAGVHAAAYIAHNQRIAFLWASTYPDAVSDATREIMLRSRLPDCCFIDDGCGHMP